ncbi:hypothetical protein [Sphingosinicella sp.]|uniref:S10 family serine carboxypeptidase-like protein n=1 Tax=Sphingosinicella sp. TaxID=1917971 RepID=UPI0035B39092
MKTKAIRRCFFAGLLLALPAAAASAEPSCKVHPTVATAETLILPTGDLHYEAGWTQLAIKNGRGVPQGTISATTYRLRNTGDNPRPIIFGFNGGPGASASGLNFGLFGPKLKVFDNGQPKLIDNVDTLLGEADLVMIDTPGSGFNCELRRGGNEYFYTAPSDARAVETFIRKWLSDNGRTGSPIFIVGESYGGYRLAVMASSLVGLNVKGAILISPALDLTDQPGSSGTPDNHYIFAFPVMAAAAAYHGRTDMGGKTISEIFVAARTFAEKPLLTALHLGSRLPETERDRLAQDMSELIGLPAERIKTSNLRIDPQYFLDKLLADRVVGRTDTRISGPARKDALIAGRSRAADDPALGIGDSNIMADTLTGDYLRSLGVKIDRPYIGLNLNMNLNLDWAFGSRKIEDTVRLNPTPRLGDLFKMQPSFRLLLVSGYYDMTTPVLAQQYALTHAGLPADRMQFLTLPGPHAVHADRETRPKVIDAIRGLILSQK